MNRTFFCMSLLMFMHYSITVFSLSFAPLSVIMKKNPALQYLPVEEEKTFCYTPFSLSEFPKRQPYQGTYEDLFILSVPKGIVATAFGFVKIGEHALLQAIPESQYPELVRTLRKTDFSHPKKISGRVAVLTRAWGHCYFHWLSDVLSRLFLLRKHNIEYDWLYVRCDKPFMKQTLTLLGVDLNRVIQPSGEYACIQADTLIVPALPNRRVLEDGRLYSNDYFLASHCRSWVIQGLREAFLPLAEKVSRKQSERVFISRKDAKVRQLCNEDAIFGLFEKRGFKRYCLAKMSFLEQVSLFARAEMIVGCHGAGFANLVFCKPKTKIIELFQARSSATFCYMSQQLQLDYYPIKTIPFTEQGLAFQDTDLPVDVVEAAIIELDTIGVFSATLKEGVDA